MRSDLFTPGPPWKLIFKDNKEFTYQTIYRGQEPPKEWTFAAFMKKGDPDRKKIVFELKGYLGNVAIYTEKT